VRNAVHHVRLDPERAVDVLCAGIPGETQDAAVAMLGVWAGDDGEGRRITSLEKLQAVLREPAAARRRLHAAFTERATTAEPGSELQFTATAAAVGVSDDVGALRALVEGTVPTGITLDAGLRWRALKRLASLDAVDVAELDRRLAEQDDAKTRVDHAWARARLPDADAKAWAWQRFTGEVAASNYEIEAVGQGFWQTGQDDLLAPYAERYLRDVTATTAHRAGWLLADAATYFFPITVMTQEVLDGVDGLLADPELNPTLRRVLVDAGDELRIRLRTRARFGAG
jgi:aminopeptidase N